MCRDEKDIFQCKNDWAAVDKYRVMVLNGEVTIRKACYRYRKWPPSVGVPGSPCPQVLLVWWTQTQTQTNSSPLLLPPSLPPSLSPTRRQLLPANHKMDRRCQDGEGKWRHHHVGGQQDGPGRQKVGGPAQRSAPPGPVGSRGGKASVSAYWWSYWLLLLAD